MITIINNTAEEHLELLVNKVLLKTSSKKEHGLTGELTIIDYDLDRVYITCEGFEYTIRMWTIWNIKNGYGVEWSFYKRVYESVDDTQGTAITLSNGNSNIICE